MFFIISILPKQPFGIIRIVNSPSPDILASLHERLSAMPKSEARVAQAVLNDPTWAAHATSVKLAERAESSTATITRLSKSLGFSNFAGFKRALIKTVSVRDADMRAAGIASGMETGGISESDSLDELAGKIAFHEARSIEHTAHGLDLDALDTVAQKIAEHRRLVLLGVGASGLVASDLVQKLQRIGVDCVYNPDTHMQLVNAAMARPDSVVLGLTFSGRTKEVVEGLRLAEANGAFPATITGNTSSPAADIAQLTLKIRAHEVELRAAALASRMAQFVIADIIFARVAQLLFTNLSEALEKTRAATDPHKL